MSIPKGTLLYHKDKKVLVKVIDVSIDYHTRKRDYEVQVISGNVFLPLHGNFKNGETVWLGPLWGWEEVPESDLAGVLYSET